jgi:hypothetical protein
MGADDFDDNTQKLANVLDEAVSDGNWTNTQLRTKAERLSASLGRAGFRLIFPVEE